MGENGVLWDDWALLGAPHNELCPNEWKLAVMDIFQEKMGGGAPKRLVTNLSENEQCLISEFELVVGFIPLWLQITSNFIKKHASKVPKKAYFYASKLKACRSAKWTASNIKLSCTPQWFKVDTWYCALKIASYNPGPRMHTTMQLIIV